MTESAAPPDACESCGSTQEQLTLVRRLYVTPPTWDQAGSVQEADQEWWCFVCRTHYPHVLPGEPIPDPPDDQGDLGGGGRPA